MIAALVEVFKLSAISIATKGKGFPNFVRRARYILTRYGLTASRMRDTVAEFVRILKMHDCRATFPVTAVALQRNGNAVSRFVQQGVELAIHGYRHVDYPQLSSAEQMKHIAEALEIFEVHGLHPKGFRCPYLRWNEGTLEALRSHKFLYDSSQSLAWDVVDTNDAYRRAIDFYGAREASLYPALPWLDRDLVCIPYTLPDDEALVERLTISRGRAMAKPWLDILHETHELGELFVIGLHPERIGACGAALDTVLQEAVSLGGVPGAQPGVWIASLADIATWWRARLQTEVFVQDTEAGLDMTIAGPQGVSVLVRGVEISVSPSERAALGSGELIYDGYRSVLANARTSIHIHKIADGGPRPFIAVSRDSSPAMVSFLRQQGYIVEVSEEPHRYSYYFDAQDFIAGQQRALLAQIEQARRPLVRLGRWPAGARSALAVTGDIDALTLWDYGLRFLGG